jgi:hypothetical protein
MAKRRREEDSQGWEWFAEHVRRELVPNMRSSQVVVSIIPSNDKFDVKLALELGAALLLDKPIVLVMPEGQQAPPRLARVADKIVYGSFKTEAGRQKILEGLKTYLKQ